MTSYLVEFCESMLNGLLPWMLDNLGEYDNLIPETIALYNAAVTSCVLTVLALVVGGMVQAFFNLFGAVYRSSGVRGVRRR